MDVTDVLTRLSELAEAPGETVMVDGLAQCKECGEPRQKRIVWMGNPMTVACRCSCEVKEAEERAKKEEERERIRRIERVRNLSMMPGKYSSARFEVYQARPENQRAYTVALKYAENFHKMERENQGLVFYGPVGTGKSFTAACIANYLMDREVPVIMTSIVKILESEWGDTHEAVRNARLLVIDDLGTERETDFALEKVYGLIDDRVRSGLPMVVTTNVPIKDMVACTDIRKKRIYDRILEVCYPVEVNGRSVRLGIAAERQSRMKEFLEGR